MPDRGDRRGCGGDIAVGRHPEANGGGPPGDEPVDLGELRLGGGEADPEALGFAGPALAFGLGDAGGQAVADGLEARPLVRVDPQERAADAAVLMDAACSPGAAAVAEGELAALEVAEELFPFGVGRGAVLLTGPQGAAAGDERPGAR